MRTGWACSPLDYAYRCDARTAYSALAGLITAFVLGALALGLHRVSRIPTTLRCLRCGTSGWVRDIEPSHGRCPCCGGERFAYRLWQAGANSAGPRLYLLREDDVLGADLLRRVRDTRRGWTPRYY